jgi:flagellar biosynthesis/type III secretory pathway chaperone
MQDLAASLIRILQRELDLYRKLLKVLKDERQALAEPRQGRLMQSLAIKENLITEQQRMEAERQEICLGIAGWLGLPAEGLTLKQIANTIAPPEDRQLSALRERLLDMVHQVKRANSTQRSMLEHRLALSQSSLTLLKDVAKPDPLYQRSGKLNQLGGAGLVLSGSI